MRKMTRKQWIGTASAIAVLFALWISLPSGHVTAQAPPAVVPVLLSNPVGLKGMIRSSQDGAGDRAVLTVTNIGDEVLEVRLAIRDALNFSTVLATTDSILKPGEGSSLPYIEDNNAFRSVIGVISPGGGRPFGSTWNGSTWSAGIRAVVASVSVTDGTSNTVKFVVGTIAMPVQRAAFEREARH